MFGSTRRPGMRGHNSLTLGAADPVRANLAVMGVLIAGAIAAVWLTKGKR